MSIYAKGLPLARGREMYYNLFIRLPCGDGFAATDLEQGLYEKLAALNADDVLPMHMPGHKRNIEKFPWLSSLGAQSDVTEIAGFDDLHAPQGAIADILRRAEKLWGSRRTFLSVNGSTGAVFAALAACGEGGVLMARNCHRSVFNAAAYLKLPAEYFDVPRVGEYGFFGSVRACDVAKRLDETGCKAVVVTSPTYEGVESDITEIAKAVHARGAVLVLDAAHGAHLGLSEAFERSGVGADIEIVSLHKTLPALTQTALLNVMTERVDEGKIAAAMTAFVTSSPSYVFMTSVEKMLGYLECKGGSDAAQLAENLDSFRLRAQGFKHIRVFDGTREKHAEIFATDHSKIYIDCKKCGFGGFELKKILREKYAIELESASFFGALAYCTLGDDERSLARLFDALAAVDREENTLVTRCDGVTDAAASDGKGALGGRGKSFACAPLWTAGEKVTEMYEAIRLPSEAVPLCEAVGRVSAEGVWAYPPGVPVLLPGERVETACVEYLQTVKNAGGEVASASGGSTAAVRVLKIRE